MSLYYERQAKLKCLIDIVYFNKSQRQFVLQLRAKCRYVIDDLVHFHHQLLYFSQMKIPFLCIAQHLSRVSLEDCLRRKKESYCDRNLSAISLEQTCYLTAHFHLTFIQCILHENLSLEYVGIISYKLFFLILPRILFCVSLLPIYPLV